MILSLKISIYRVNLWWKTVLLVVLPVLYYSFFYVWYFRVASPLAMLYSTSVMEHHHFDHCIMILNSEVIIYVYSSLNCEFTSSKTEWWNTICYYYLYLYHKIHKIILTRSLKISKHLAIQLKLAHINWK